MKISLSLLLIATLLAGCVLLVPGLLLPTSGTEAGAKGIAVNDKGNRFKLAF